MQIFFAAMALVGLCHATPVAVRTRQAPTSSSTSFNISQSHDGQVMTSGGYPPGAQQADQAQQQAQQKNSDLLALLGNFTITLTKSSATQSVFTIVDSTSNFANGVPIRHTNQQTTCTINKSVGPGKNIQCTSGPWQIFYDTGSPPPDVATVRHYVKYQSNAQRKREASQIPVFLTDQSKVGQAKTYTIVEWATGWNNGQTFDYIDAAGPPERNGYTFP